MGDIVQRLRWWAAKKKPPAGMPTLPADCAAGADEIERLQANVDRLTGNQADHRYWEGRWRDEVAENERLRASNAKLREIAREAHNNAIELAADAGYAACAETRHVTLGHTVSASIRNLRVTP